MVVNSDMNSSLRKPRFRNSDIQRILAKLEMLHRTPEGILRGFLYKNKEHPQLRGCPLF